jgi:hypothetical protein
MTDLVIPRHLVDNESSLKELEKGLEHITENNEISRTNNLGLEFGLILTLDSKKSTPDVIEKVRETRRKIEEAKDIWFHYNDHKVGAGANFAQAIFNPSFKETGPVVILSCLDQYILGTEDSVKVLKELAERTKKDNLLYGNGSRDREVRIAAHKRNSDLRIIHELFHSLTATRIRGLPSLASIGKIPEGVTPSYAEIGESSSGLYVVNYAHSNYSELEGKVNKASQVADMKSGFTLDYFTIMETAKLGRIVRGYVITGENKFHYKMDEQQELDERIKPLIINSSRELGKTRLKDELLLTLALKQSRDRISEFYPKEEVEYVRDLMYNSIVPSH